MDVYNETDNDSGSINNDGNNTSQADEIDEDFVSNKIVQ